ncbi:MAG TPA: Ppx/GppA phosphatase family protein [Acidimicrobiales bacterium]|jgi:exopolyphosphatase/guanosine-5'-triphosphate,3'-diphosphate pyrophosphatase
MSTVAAIDCGTNSTRLLVARDGKAIERHMTITRLGQDVDATGQLQPEALNRNFTTLRSYREIMDGHGVERVRAAATSAARDATNSEDFFGVATEIIGTRPELLTGDEEGRLSFVGATSDLDGSDGPFLIADIGGGSTELIVGTTDVEGVRSIDVGCVRVTERFLEHDPPQPEELTNALTVVGQHLDDVIRDVPAVLSARTFVGLAGTITTLAQIQQGLVDYHRDAIHHFLLQRDDVEAIFRDLATATHEERLEEPGLPAGRADVIVGGLIVLLTIMRTLQIGQCLVSEADILDGLAQSIA